ncbi:MAG TPA: hypothetical protein VHV83_17650 [Armatimonadota bacterium]|nr:hypothetical protein [Armatimonadota bacterium]
MADIEIECRNCHSIGNVPELYVGNAMQCNKCGHRLIIPATNSPVFPNNVSQQGKIIDVILPIGRRKDHVNPRWWILAIAVISCLTVFGLIPGIQLYKKEKLASFQGTRPKNATGVIVWSCFFASIELLYLICFMALFGFDMATSDTNLEANLPSSRSKTEKNNNDSTLIHLNASVWYENGEFTITNNDDYDWTNVRLTINPSLFGGYNLHVTRIRAKSTYRVGCMQFTKRNGTRFNPYQTAVEAFKIASDIPNDDMGFWDGSFAE